MSPHHGQLVCLVPRMTGDWFVCLVPRPTGCTTDALRDGRGHLLHARRPGAQAAVAGLTRPALDYTTIAQPPQKLTRVLDCKMSLLTLKPNHAAGDHRSRHRVHAVLDATKVGL